MANIDQTEYKSVLSALMVSQFRMDKHLEGVGRKQ